MLNDITFNFETFRTHRKNIPYRSNCDQTSRRMTPHRRYIAEDDLAPTVSRSSEHRQSSGVGVEDISWE
jgi:hypothetical protein